MSYNPNVQKYLDYSAFILDYRKNHNVSPPAQEAVEKLGISDQTEKHYRTIFIMEEHKAMKEQLRADVQRRWFGVIDGISDDIKTLESLIRDKSVSTSDRISAIKLRRDLLIDVMKANTEGLMFLDDFENIIKYDENHALYYRKDTANATRKLKKKVKKSLSLPLPSTSSSSDNARDTDTSTSDDVTPEKEHGQEE